MTKKMKSIGVSEETHNLLQRICKKGQSYENLILQILFEAGKIEFDKNGKPILVEEYANVR